MTNNDLALIEDVEIIPDGWAPAAHDLLEQRPDLAGVGVSDAVNAVVSA